MPSCKVGSFAMNTATGNQSVSGLGFPPKAVYLFGNFRAADGYAAETSEQSGGVDTLGFGVGVAVSASSRADVSVSDDFASGQFSRQEVTECYALTTGGGTPSAQADFVTMDADGFTINWGTVDGTARIVNYLAVGGADLTNVALVQKTVPNATGNQTVSGLGFQPDALMMIGIGHSAAGALGGARFTQGFASSASARNYRSMIYVGGTGIVKQWHRTNKVYGANVFGFSGVIDEEADFVSFNSDGYVLNWTAATAQASWYLALCLKGGAYAAGSFVKRTSTGGNVIAGLGVTPTGLLLHSNNTVAATDDSSAIQHHMGAASGVSARASIQLSDNAFGWKGLDRTKVLKLEANDATPTLQYAADLASFDVGGFTLTESTVDAIAKEILFFAAGSAVTYPQSSRGQIPIQQRMG